MFAGGVLGCGRALQLRRGVRPEWFLRIASIFSTPRRQIGAVANAIWPTPRSTAIEFHGSPTQIPSTSPAASASAANEVAAGDDTFDILIGTNADTASQPIAQHVIVARIAMDDAEAQMLARREPRVRHLLQRRADTDRVTSASVRPVSVASLVEKVTALPLRPRTKGTASGTAEWSLPRVVGDGERRDHVRGVGMAIE